MSKSKLLYIFLAVYFFGIFIPINYKMYFGRTVVSEVTSNPVIKLSTTAPLDIVTSPIIVPNTSPQELPIEYVPSEDVDDSTLGSLKRSLMVQSTGILDNVDIYSNTLTIISDENPFNPKLTEDSTLLCYMATMTTPTGTVKTSDLYLDFNAMPLDLLSKFVDISKRTTFSAKKEFLLNNALKSPIKFGLWNDNLAWILVFSDNCGEFLSTR
jgi:hypothetical protein